MTFFTDSPYERMMIQPPSAGRGEAPAFPARSPLCQGCPYGRDSPCLGVCYRKLMKRRSDKHTTCDR